jgi:hypothetical protein
MIRLRILITGSVLLLAASAAFAMELRDRQPTPLFTAMYDFNVCDYCGLISYPVYDGYNREVRAMIAAGDLPADYVHRTDFNAMIAADEEYSNRGLVGNRLWCRKEGREAALHFAAVHFAAIDAAEATRR